MLTADAARKLLPSNPVTLDEIEKCIAAYSTCGLRKCGGCDFTYRPVAPDVLKTLEESGYTIMQQTERYWSVAW